MVSLTPQRRPSKELPSMRSSSPICRGRKCGFMCSNVSKVLDADRYRQEKAAVDALILRTKNIYASVIAQAKKAQAQHEEQVQCNQIVREFSATDGLTQGLATC